jgi:hypothetical protein
MAQNNEAFIGEFHPRKILLNKYSLRDTIFPKEFETLITSIKVSMVSDKK